ncbi:tetratricopeptide repeat protein [Bosea sp. F3-2]|uniref:tetratricopeptide repeat protein n=1 Tax=Bosea sp. F3-2 TaxID=2599640 RepID=UPI0011EC6A77|nr:tetratricopeptide repeat protein [Bosea sp. F3-2]
MRAREPDGRDAEAKRVLEAALKRNPADVDIATALLQKALRDGDLKSALQLVDRLIGLGPEDPMFAEIRKRLHN